MPAKFVPRPKPKGTKKDQEDHAAWMKKHADELQASAKRLGSNTREAKKKADEAFWKAEAAKDRRNGLSSTKEKNSGYVPGAVGAKKETTKYTGTAAKGISQMHKSNAVPIFDFETAKEITKMRR